MNKVNLSEIKEDPWQSPKGKYVVAFKGISEALSRGRARESGHRASVDTGEPWPFDLELNRMPPGKPNFPFHAHSAQWEMYLIISGKAKVRDKDGMTEVVAGDAFVVLSAGRSYFRPEDLLQLGLLLNQLKRRCK